MQTRLSHLLFSGGLLVGCAFSATAQPLDDSVGDGIGIEQKLDAQVPLGLSFRDETGSMVRLDQLVNDRPVILSLAYYECPMLCTQVLNGLLRGLRVVDFNIGQDFDVLTVSIDPGETSALAAGKKREYIGGYGRDGAASGWHFLTGDQASIDALAESVGFNYEYDAETDNYIHASGIMVLTPEGRIARYLYGVEYSPKDLRFSLMEAAQHTIGSPVDELLLLCYQYDPTTGKYGLVIMNSLRVAGGLTVAVLAGLIISTIRRDRRQQALSHANPSPPAPHLN